MHGSLCAPTQMGGKQVGRKMGTVKSSCRHQPDTYFSRITDSTYFNLSDACVHHLVRGWT